MTLWEMNCRIARAYKGWPHEPWHWPFTYWLKVWHELVESWKPVPQKDEEDA